MNVRVTQETRYGLFRVAGAFVLSLLPAILFASEGQGHAEVESPFILVMRVVNFLLLIGLLYFLLRKPIQQFLNHRQQAVREALDSAQKAQADAENRHREVEEKLKQAQHEMEQLKKMLFEQGRVEKEKILANAEQEAEKIRKGAEIAAEVEFKKAQLLLRQEAVQLAGNLAEALLENQLNEEDHERLVHEYLNTFGKTN